MSAFTIVTDSAADLNAAMATELEITVLPLSFVIEGQTYQDYPDRRDMGLDVFYGKLRSGQMATTNAVNVSDYTAALEPLLASGQDVLILAFSSVLSSTCQSALFAAGELREKYPQRKLLVVDTLCASMGQALLVLQCVRLRREGASIEQVRDWAEEHKLQVCHHFTVDDLHFLKRGGRVSAATAVVGTMLAVKPVLRMDDHGCLVSSAKARGRVAALKTLVDTMEKTAIAPAEHPVFLGHADCLEDAQTVADMIRARTGAREIYISQTGPVIGAHVGPGTITLFFMGSPR